MLGCGVVVVVVVVLGLEWWFLGGLEEEGRCFLVAAVMAT
jgi:hypothetical protein